jgi:hypothetical protein
MAMAGVVATIADPVPRATLCRRAQPGRCPVMASITSSRAELAAVMGLGYIARLAFRDPIDN